MGSCTDVSAVPFAVRFFERQTCEESLVLHPRQGNIDKLWGILREIVNTASVTSRQLISIHGIDRSFPLTRPHGHPQTILLSHWAARRLSV